MIYQVISALIAVYFSCIVFEAQNDSSFIFRLLEALVGLYISSSWTVLDYN